MPAPPAARRGLRRHATAVVLIAVGGLLGANLRFAASAVAGGALVATLLVNAAGSFALGLLLFDARAADLLSRRLRYVFGTGFLASFTTYSTFVADVALAEPTVALAYVLGSYATGFGAVAASRVVVETLGNTTIGPPAGGAG